MLTPEDLLLVVAISEAGSVTAAADRLSTSQPAVSRALNALERRVGARLFDRQPRGMTPTAAGESLLLHGQAVQAVTERALRQLVAQQTTQTIELVVGIVPHLSVLPLSRAIAALHRFQRGVQVDARVGTAAALIRELRAGALDLFIGPLPPADPQLIATPLFDDRPVLATRFDHPLLRGPGDDDLAALCSYPWVTPPPSDPASERIRALFRDAELEPPRPAVITRDVPLTTTIVGTSDFVTILPRDVAMIAVGLGRLAVLPIELPGPPNPIGALLRRDVPHGPEIAQLLEALRAELLTAGIGPRVEPQPSRPGRSGRG